MNLSIIDSFIIDQRKAKELLHEKLGVSPDIKAIDWVNSYSDVMEKYKNNPFAITFYPHGFGLELAVGDLYIDYDYSKEGLPDGFDAWRLYVYIMAGDFNNNGPDDYFCHRVLEWFRKLESDGKVVQHDNLYYLA
ncbi:hypothetical protein BVX97_02265 [bacterium E08(2017)]|nr:hypothetical protein BVX97_02265 [bacterium E08(2017)]